ncbi:universal stress protein [Mycolicibacterium sp. P9-64]|nr:universal stress protein [Mycolicibacterium sp. P9-64]
MQDTHRASPSVVVGIDGSRNGISAALWAVDEAVERDIPLRLVCAVEPREGPVDPERAARALATAEIAVRTALTAVESTDKPVKIEVEILQGLPAATLLEAGRAAEMICIGATGIKHATSGRVGSTAAALAGWAHSPVAIIRGYDPMSTTPRSVVVEVDQSPESDVLIERGIQEAQLRHAPLVVISAWQAGVTDIHDGAAVDQQNRSLEAQLNRRLARWTRRYPKLDVQSVAVRGDLLNYLSPHAHSIQLVVVGGRRSHGIAEMVGPPSYLALHDTDCSVLICNSHNPL